MCKMVRKEKSPQWETHKKRSRLIFDWEYWTSPVTKSPINEFHGNVRRQKIKEPCCGWNFFQVNLHHQACEDKHFCYEWNPQELDKGKNEIKF